MTRGHAELHCMRHRRVCTPARRPFQAVRERAAKFDGRKAVAGAGAADNEKLLYQQVEAQASVLSALLMFLEPTWSEALSGAMLLRSAYNSFNGLAKSAGLTPALVAELGDALPPFTGDVAAVYGVLPSEAAGAPPPQPPSEGAAPPTPPHQSSATPRTFPCTIGAALRKRLPNLHPVVAGGIAFGSGVFNLLLALLPPSRRAVAQWWGFSGDREYGLASLRLALGTGSMNAIFASFLLMSFHTSMAMFHTRGDGKGLVEAGGILQRCLTLYPASAVFQWYQGRWLRAAGAVHEAAAAYRRAHAAQSQWSSLRALCEYELAWCALLQVDFRTATVLFGKLAAESSWSKCFCAFAQAAAALQSGDVHFAATVFATVPGLATTKGGRTPQFEAWAVARAERFGEAYAGLRSKLASASATSVEWPDVETALSPATGASSGEGGASAGSAAAHAGGPVRHIAQVIAALLSGEDANSVACASPLSGAAPGASGGPEAAATADAASASQPTHTPGHADFLLFSPALELAYLWNTFPTSTPLVQYALQWTTGWLAHRQGRVAALYIPAHTAHKAASSGFLGIGAKPPQCAFADEDLAAAQLVQAAALREVQRPEQQVRCLGAVAELVQECRVSPSSHAFWGPAFYHFERAAQAAQAGDTPAALEALAAVQAVPGLADVYFGNRLSFRAQQMEADLREGRVVVTGQLMGSA